MDVDGQPNVAEALARLLLKEMEVNHTLRRQMDIIRGLLPRHLHEHYAAQCGTHGLPRDPPVPID